MSSLTPTKSLHPVQACLTTVAAVLIIVMLATPTHALNANVVVFTDRHHPVIAPTGVRIVHLDAAHHLKARLSADLPKDSTQAATVAQQRLQDGGADLQKRLAIAYQGLVDAWSLGVTQIPAVVVDRQYVVYGDPDVSRALIDIATFRRVRP
ncbi:TIGR03757 family integrating conjugative element protein [uncultured Porticoccus sp.]|uniref:TIGR03757 family integrating conjugative element protein n=1 Tax=uncultured Porticoccus sp. TaxID=1256050 RepID=UPI00262F1ADA|nr:TIGR03757 family integrating conjugative element protein [uncultured Porticoccus sp.]|tara:strand:+ start:90647 stop:91102 length:456 start_codon:yes stop_codon:yes gene_type:complete